MDLGNLSPMENAQITPAAQETDTANRAAWEKVFIEKYNFSNDQLEVFMKHLTMSVMSAVNKMMRKSREKIKKLKQERGS